MTEDLLVGCDEISSRMRRDFRTCAKVLEAKGLLHKEAGQYVLHWPTYLDTLRPGWKRSNNGSRPKKARK